MSRAFICGSTVEGHSCSDRRCPGYDRLTAFVEAATSVHRPSHVDLSWLTGSGVLGRCGVEVGIIRSGQAARIEWHDADDPGICYSVMVDSPEELHAQLQTIITSADVCRCCGRRPDERGKCPTALPATPDVCVQLGSASCACRADEVLALRARVTDAETKLVASHEAIGILRHELREVREGLAILRSHARFGGVP